MRFVAPLFSSLAILLVVTARIIAVLFDNKDVNLQQWKASAQQSDFSAQPKPIDVASFMQGARIQLDRLSLQDNDSSQDDLGMYAPSVKPKRSSEYMSTKTKLGSQDVSSRAVRAIGMLATSLHTKFWSSLMESSIQLANGSSYLGVVMIVFLIGCICLVGSSMVFSEEFALDRREQQFSVSTLSPMSSKELSQEREAGIIRSSPGSRTSEGPPERNLPNTSLPSPRAAGLSGPFVRSFLDGPLTRPPSTRASTIVPPLCSAFEMPFMEARFGIPVAEIRKLMKSGAGEIVILGYLANPLLRAVVKQVGTGNARSLEITMPTRDGVPRATCTPTAPSTAESLTTLEIRGMGNSFYGYLVMTKQATYITHDGQTVLSVGGEAASFQLLLKSSNGSKVADARCSSEAFGGSDHVEVRVEPGVDTVLIIATVLSVLLLSRWST